MEGKRLPWLWLYVAYLTRFITVESVRNFQESNAEWIFVSGGPGLSPGSPSSPVPGPRSRAAGWGDDDGNFWMFGGIGHDSSDTTNAHITNDLWVFNISAMSWRRIQEPNLAVDSLKRPPPRRGAVVCGVTGVVLMLYGGEGLNGKMLDDTWLYDITKDSWIVLTDAKKMSNSPTGRVSPVWWCLPDSLIIYGGKLNDTILSDMWQFSLLNLTWSKMTPLSGLETPGRRIGATTWVHDKELWLFGGSVASDSSPGTAQLQSDLWKFSRKTRQWLLYSRGTVSNDIRVGQVRTRAYSTEPEPRKFSQSWSSNTENALYLFGGEGHDRLTIYNDQSELFQALWRFDVTRREWERIPFVTARLKTTRNTSGEVYGRSRANSWNGPQGEFYTFGGLVHGNNGEVTQMNDVWSLIPPKTAIPSIFRETILEIVQITTARSAPTRSPAFIFLMVLLTFGGMAMLVGMIFCMKKMADYPRHNPRDKFWVRYSKLDVNEIDIEGEAEEFLLSDHEDYLKDARESFNILRK